MLQCRNVPDVASVSAVSTNNAAQITTLAFRMLSEACFATITLFVGEEPKKKKGGRFRSVMHDKAIMVPAGCRCYTEPVNDGIFYVSLIRTSSKLE